MMSALMRGRYRDAVVCNRLEEARRRAGGRGSGAGTCAGAGSTFVAHYAVRIRPIDDPNTKERVTSAVDSVARTMSDLAPTPVARCRRRGDRRRRAGRAGRRSGAADGGPVGGRAGGVGRCRRSRPLGSGGRLPARPWLPGPPHGVPRGASRSWTSPRSICARSCPVRWCGRASGPTPSAIRSAGRRLLLPSAVAPIGSIADKVRLAKLLARVKKADATRAAAWPGRHDDGCAARRRVRPTDHRALLPAARRRHPARPHARRAARGCSR